MKHGKVLVKRSERSETNNSCVVVIVPLVKDDVVSISRRNFRLQKITMFKKGAFLYVTPPFFYHTEDQKTEKKCLLSST